MERPQQISRFAILAVAASLMNFAATSVLTHFTSQGMIGAAIGVAIVVGLVLWIIRGRGMAGRLLLTIWLVFGIGASLASDAYLMLVHRTDVMSPSVETLSVFNLLANCAALLFLWSRASTAWLEKQPEPSERP